MNDSTKEKLKKKTKPHHECQHEHDGSKDKCGFDNEGFYVKFKCKHCGIYYKNRTKGY